MTRCYLFDIDGTVADLRHRLHHIEKAPKDWDAFFAACVDDEPFPHICELVRDIQRAGNTIVYVSGRSDHVLRQTQDWLYKHVGLFGWFYMRRHGDHRPDHIVKAELLERIRADGFAPIMAFDDRNQVVEDVAGEGPFRVPRLQRGIFEARLAGIENPAFLDIQNPE